MTFAPIESVARAMAGFPRHWWVSGGWSIDLFVGDVTRTHEDLEVGIARADQRLLQEYLTDRSLCKAVQFPEGGRWVPWEPDERLELPVFQIQARRDDADPPEFEIFLNDIEDGLWRFRRDLTFTRPADELTLTSARDLPIIAP